MKHGRRYQKNTKKKLIKNILSIAIGTMLIVCSTLAGFSAPVKNLKIYMSSANINEDDTREQKITGENISIMTEGIANNRIIKANAQVKANTNTVTYIYTAQDLATFRNNVNNGNDYAGKTVKLMADIDLSTVCSTTKGSWVPIGTTTYFAGTFDGNYHKIKNLYISTASYVYVGLFSRTASTTIIQNLIMENVNVNSTYYIGGGGSSATGGIVGNNVGKIQRCAVISGKVDGRQTASVSGDRIVSIGGIMGDGYGTIDSCYNKATITGYTHTSNNTNNIRLGGIIGQLSGGTVTNCYNTGAIAGQARRFYVGGVVGCYHGNTNIMRNCYNTGRVTVNGSAGGQAKAGGIAGINGDAGQYVGQLTNSYCLDTTNTYSYYYAGTSPQTAGKITSATLQTYTVQLGSAYNYDIYNINSGYPVLAWQNERTVMKLNKNQAYIKTGETLQLNVVEENEVTEIIGNNYNATNFKWVSTNEDVAVVDPNGQVRGITDGYTTIYAYHTTSAMYTMCIVNVAKETTNPQIETGNGFTTILKADGTVWAVGNNSKGTIGNGTKTNSKEATNVYIDEDTKLNNIVKIAVGTDHILALTKEGRIYAWGDNTYGQLGQNNTNSLDYAKLVLSENGTSYLSNIVDISAGAYGSMALDQNGDVYVWGRGTTGEIGNYTVAQKNLPTKTTIKKAIQVSMGDGTVGALTSDGVVWSWGQNTSGQLGINCTANTTYPMKTALNVTELSVGGYHTTIKKTDGTAYAVGSYSYGRLGTGSTANITKYAKVNLPSTVKDDNKVKYIKAGIINTTIVLTDGSVWETGFNLQGELGNGNTTTATSFVKGLTAENTPLENVLTVGRNNGNVAGSVTTGYGLNTAVILKNGDIYTTGDNSYGQIGDNTNTKTSYYKKMGYAYLDYEDKTIEVDENGYKLDLNKLKYIYSSINAYNNEQEYTVGDVKYTSLNTSIAEIDNNGFITAKKGTTGVVQIKIEDITNGYETYISAIINKLGNTDTITYIYNVDDMMAFRDSVNDGNNYAGKIVYVMADIDLSKACSSTVGTWKSIGATGVVFAGTFDGNYHKISNLYISERGTTANLGLFAGTSGKIQNLILDNVNVSVVYTNANRTTTNLGIVAAYSSGNFQNIGIQSGNVYIEQMIATGNDRIMNIGGIVGSISGNGSSVIDCYNKANFVGNSSSANNNSCNFRLGGIIGQQMTGCKEENCYNRGNITVTGSRFYVGGVNGITYTSGQAVTVNNCYNTGIVSINGAATDRKKAGGIVGTNGDSNSARPGTIANSYCLTNSNAYSYWYWNWSRLVTTTLGKVAEATLKAYAPTLGTAYENDDLNINNGYPILWWEATKIELNKKQEYIKVGETLELSVIQNEEITKALGKTLNTNEFIWTSTNEDVATVNQNAVVTGISDGYTTIYGYYEPKKIYVMCIVNVSQEKANPQIETGENFTAILKADGTVWTIGNNTNGELGDGTTEERIRAVQVKIDENTYLTDVVKISAGTNHVLALTKDGKVYSWGSNTYGQLGQKDTQSSNYAKLVVDEGGTGELNRIVDISAGNYGSTAINQFGWTYVWGNGTYGEMADGKAISSKIPVKIAINTAISVSTGAGHNIALGQNGALYSWGRNSYGELGIGNTTNKLTVAKISKGITEISASGYTSIVKDTNGNVYGTGLNTTGQLATGTKVNATKLTKAVLPTEVISTNKIKYIKAGRTSTTIMLKDGTVYTVGENAKGELGNGTSTSYANFIKAQEKINSTKSANGNEEINSKDLEDVIMIGRSSGETASLNIVVIKETGRVYTSGANTNGQIGNDTKDDQKYFTLMEYKTVDYPEKIELEVGETKEITQNELMCNEIYFNVYREDKITTPLIGFAEILNSNIATYQDNMSVSQNGIVEGKAVGNTTLIVQKEDSDVLIYIPVKVLAEEGIVVPDVKTGRNFTATLRVDGTVWTFGTNTYGELGLGDTKARNYPHQVELLKDEVIEQISVGNSHTIVLTEDGKVYTFGLNNKGQLGNGNTSNSNIPQEIEIPKEDILVEIIKQTVVKVIANKNESYVLTQNGKVYAWGEKYGSNPVLLTELRNIIDISNSYALDTNGNVYNLTTKERLQIVEEVKYISEGTSHTVFLSKNGTAYAIGLNTFGQFGDGTNVSNTTEVVAIRNEQVNDVIRNVVKVEAGDGYTTLLLKDGRILSTGINREGQLGTLDLDEVNRLTEITNASTLISNLKQSIILLDAGTDHIAIGLADGNVYAWGLNEDGQLGNGSNNNTVEPELVGKNTVETNTNNILLGVDEVFDIEGRATHFNLIRDNNKDIIYESKNPTVVEVDSNTGGVQARKEGTTVIVARETGTTNIGVIQVRILPKGIKIEPQVSTSGSHTVTLKVDGTVWSYGNNTNGELGNGTKKYSDEPVQAIFPDNTEIIQVSAGENFSIALDGEGNVWAWGANDYYQLGNNTSNYETAPIKVEGLSNITKIIAGTYSCIAIDENKEVYGWGLNSNGELGIGSYTNKVAEPTKAKYITDIIDVAVGKNHAIALKTTGEVYVTGLNIYGQLGNNDTSIKKVSQFTKVEGINEVARITATDSGNVVSSINGKVYAWGLNIYGELGLGDKVNRYEPVQVPNLENIVKVSGGKNHTIALDKDGKIYLTGSNKYGQLGRGNTNDDDYFKTIDIDDVMTISAGNTYTAIAKTDGTVWGFGDYNHGDISLKSKTKSPVPMQVGNDDFGLGVTKIVVRKSETVNIASNIAYSFNLIYLNQNERENVTYRSLNEDIAIVNQNGEVLGVREGFTWVEAIEEDGKVHVVYVYVIDNEGEYAPDVSAGEDFAVVLKSDGTIWTFGHNNNGELGIGTNKTKDIPQRTNVNASYKEISTGNNFTLSIRKDGTVWSFGENNYGQLGTGNTKNGLSSAQVNGLTDIVQIATGANHSVAVDSYGILYGWGRNNNGQLGKNNETLLTPTVIPYTNGTINSIFAGEDETIIINTKGKIYGYGDILNGELEGIDHAVKVSVGKGYMIILTTNGEVYKYEGGTLSKYTEISNATDIDVKEERIIVQALNEKAYTFTKSTAPKLEDMENVYTIAVGTNNAYVIKTDGTVYAKGNNKYGQLGNSTRIDSSDFTLVGDREFTIEPESKIMYENDVEDITTEIKVNEFNVFNKSIRNGEEYTWESSDSEIVKVSKGILTAMKEGTAQITVTDNITGAEVTITRVVMPIEKDRIEYIKVNDNQAVIKEEYKYSVEVETDENTGTLEIKTKDNRDKISIDNGATWYENGILKTVIDIPTDETEVPIIIETTNGTQIEYMLTIKKISIDTSLLNITVDGNTAIATSSKLYEIVVPEGTDISKIIATANSQKAKVSVNGEKYETWKSTVDFDYESKLIAVLPITVQAENGDEDEYSLTIYKESSVLQLKSLTVDGKDAIKTSETVYSATISRDLKTVDVFAEAITEIVKVSINNENAKIKASTKTIKIKDELTEVTIRLSTTIGGQEIYKDYTLNIYKKPESGNIQFVIVNGQVLTRKPDGTYETYLPAETENAEVKVIAQNSEDYVQIEDNQKEKSTSIVTVTTPDDVNTYIIKIIDDENNEENYTLYIKKPSLDTTLKNVTVSYGEDIVTASKSKDEENVYIAKVKTFDEYTITAITNNINAKVGIAESPIHKNTATKIIAKTDEYMEVLINVESENGETEEYTLKIYIMSSDASLEFITVNGKTAILQPDGVYLVNLETAELEVDVTAQATNEKAEVKIDSEEYEVHTTIRKVTIDSKDTVRNIYVKAEDGTLKRYTLLISGLPDDATLQKVVVNGQTAKYIEGQQKYEIRLDSTEFNIEAIATDSLAKVSLNDEEAQVGRSTITVTKAGATTIVKIKVTAQDGVDFAIYALEIKEKSNDTSISSVTVNGKQATTTATGDYEASIGSKDNTAVIKIKANDSYAIVYLDEVTSNTDNITVTKEITERKTIYNIKVIAEDGTEEEHTLTITKLSGNVDIKELAVITSVESENEETGEIETTEKEEILTPREDGTYYLKIDRVDSVDVRAILEDENASVRIKNSEYEKAQKVEKVNTVAEITEVVITVQAEDGTTKSYSLVLEKKSNDTTIKTISSDNILKQENYKIYVDEDLTEIELTLVTNSDYAYIKLEDDEEYTLKQITRTVSITDDNKVEGDLEEGIGIKVLVQAEDGTIGEHTIRVIKTGNIKIKTVKVKDQLIPNKDDTYTARVNVANQTQVEIETENTNAKIEIIEVIENADGTQTETIKATGIGTLQTDVDLKENPQKYKIRITSSKGSTSHDYDLIIEQKSTDTGIVYVKVDDVAALETEQGYTSVVSGKEYYPVQIKLTDEKAEVKIAYRDYTGNYQQGKILEAVDVEDGETLEVTITVKAENGNEEEYKLYITRISSNTQLEYVKVDGETVTNYDSGTKTYTITIDNSLTEAEIEAKAVSDTAKVTILSTTETQIATTKVELQGQGTSKIVKIRVEAENGAIEEYSLKIIQLSAGVSLQKIAINGKEATTKDKYNYEITISNKEEIAKVVATAKENTSSVSISEETSNVGSSTKDFEVVGRDTIKTTINVTAEDGITTQEYTLTIYVLDNDKTLEYVKVNGDTVTDFNEETSTYSVIVDNTLTEAVVSAKTISEVAKITIGEDTEVEIIEKTIALSGPGKTTNVRILVTAEDSEQKEYILTIYQKSNDATLDKITVNEETATLNETTGKYEIEIEDSSNVAEIVAIAGQPTSKVSIAGETATVGSSRKTRDINGHEIIEMVIIVTAEDGTEENYNLQITVLETSANTSYVRVNSGRIMPEEDGVTYKTFINFDSTSAKVEIKSESEYATIKITNKNEISILEENQNKGELSFEVTTPNEVTTIKYTVTSETGETKENTIILTKISTDNTLKEVRVDDVLIQVDEDGNYYVNLESAKTVLVKAITNNEYANIRINYNEEERHQTEAEINSSKSSTKVTMTVTSQAGVTAKYYLYIRVLTDNTDLDKVIIDGTEITNYNEDTNTYTAIVDNTKTEYEIFLMAVNNQATVELFDGENLVGSGLGNVTELVTITDEEHEYKVKVSLDEENYSIYTLKVVKISNDTSLKLVEVNDVVREPTPEDISIYEVGIPRLAETAKIRVESTNKYATVQIGDSEEVLSGTSVVITLSLAESRITVPVVVTAVDGTTIDTYNIILIRQSNDTRLASLKVNETEVENIDNVYTYYMEENEEDAFVEISTDEDNNATIKVDELEGIGYLEFTEEFDETTIKIEKKIIVKSEDGTAEQEYTLVLRKKTQISGKIITENFENKHISKISLYKIVTTGAELVKEIDTNEDGSYEIDFDEVGNYYIVVQKLGYLNYTVTNIDIKPRSMIDLGTHNLLAGNVTLFANIGGANNNMDSDSNISSDNDSGNVNINITVEQIEIDDLVDLNDNIGVVISDDNKLDKLVYDLNEDGVIDHLDRNILKKNYGKLTEIVDFSQI